MVVKQKYKMNSTLNNVETNTEKQLMCVISLINVLTLAQ